MKNTKTTILIILSVLAQISIMPNLKIFNFFPNLPLLILIIYLIRQDDYKAIWWVIFGGLLMDIFSAQFFGYYSLQFIVIFCLYRFTIRTFLHDPAYPLVPVIFAGLSLIIALIDGIIIRQNIMPVLPIIIIYQSSLGLLIFTLSLKLKPNKHLIKT